LECKIYINPKNHTNNVKINKINQLISTLKINHILTCKSTQKLKLKKKPPKSKITLKFKTITKTSCKHFNKINQLTSTLKMNYNMWIYSKTKIK